MYRAGQEEIDEVSKVILSKKWFRVGSDLKECENFEKEWAEKMGVPYVLLMNGGGTGALTCALAGMEIGPGDEVIVPAYTWLASATAVLAVGAIPVLAEVDESLGLDPLDFEKKISPQTKAVIPVHMAGRPANLEAICAIAKKQGIKVLEDSCQMDGGMYKGKRTGTWGDAGAFSLNYFKIISAGGEGGVLVTHDRQLFTRATIYHDSGTAFRPGAGELQVPIFVAQQYRAGEVTGAIARVQMKRLDGIIADLRKNQKRLAEAVPAGASWKITPNNDPEGDCGVMLSLQFTEEAAAKAFAKTPGLGAFVLINHDKHVYTNWTMLREKRFSHHPDMNPFNFPKNKNLRVDFTDGACPKTLAILRRTVFINIDPDWTESQICEKQGLIRNALKA